jgi:AraC family transcriptional regulator
MENATAKTALERYHARMQRVLDYIDQHLDEDLTLQTLSGVAAFSQHHFHRQFKAVFGITLHRYVQLLRMRHASYRLAFRPDHTVTDIAMDVGYEAPEAFARAFKQRFGQAPTEFRKLPDWDRWLAASNLLTEVRASHMQNTFTADQVKIIETKPTAVALMEHRGNPSNLGRTIQRFISWRTAMGLNPKVSATYTIFHDPEPQRPEHFHVDLCAATDRVIAAGGQDVKPGTIPGGRCAMLTIVGFGDDLKDAASYLYREWLPQSGEETRDFPLYCQRVSFYPDVPQNEAVTTIFLPLK